MGWTLKKTDGQVFEDRTLEELVHWARSAQINPYDELSEDGQHWRKAFEFQQLEMEWIVTLNDGTEYGPTNVPTLLEFISVKLLAEDGIAVHRETRDRQPLPTLIRAFRDKERKLAEAQNGPPPSHPPATPVTFAAVFGRRGSPEKRSETVQKATVPPPSSKADEVDYQTQPLPSPLEAPPPAPVGVIMPDTQLDPANDPDFVVLEHEVLQAKSNYDKLLKKYEKLVQRAPKNPAATR